MATIRQTTKLELIAASGNVTLANIPTLLTQAAAATAVSLNDSDQAVPTSSTILDVGALSYPLFVQLVNLSANYVDIALDNANAANGPRLLASGGTFCAYLTAAIYLKANTATCNVRRLLIKP